MPLERVGLAACRLWRKEKESPHIVSCREEGRVKCAPFAEKKGENVPQSNDQTKRGLPKYSSISEYKKEFVRCTGRGGRTAAHHHRISRESTSRHPSFLIPSLAAAHSNEGAGKKNRVSSNPAEGGNQIEVLMTQGRRPTAILGRNEGVLLPPPKIGTGKKKRKDAFQKSVTRKGKKKCWRLTRIYRRGKGT